jgi:hypothetical protein
MDDDAFLVNSLNTDLLTSAASAVDDDPKPPKRIFPEASTDARAAKHVPSSPQTESVAYRLAFQDTEFLLREDLRPVRFQLELLKPELLMNEANIASTFVFYGSARVPEPAKAQALLEAARTDWDKKVAERLIAKSKYYEEARKLAAGSAGSGRRDGKRHFTLLWRRAVFMEANRGA